VVAFSVILAPSFSKGVFTKVKAKALFYTKSQSDSRYLTASQGDGRYLTPAQGDGRYLTPVAGDDRYLPDGGEIRLNASPLTWQKLNAAITIQVSPTTGETTFGGSTGAIDNMPAAIEPSLPTVFAGQPLTFVGVNACYGTSQTTIDTATINLTTNTTGGGNTSQLLNDPTDRTDDACRDYILSTPHVLAPGEDVDFEFVVDYSANAQFFHAGRATFIFEL